MKRKVLTIILLLLLVISLILLARTTKTPIGEQNKRYDIELKDSYARALSKQITTAKSFEEAKIEKEITRAEMAKMISNFSKNVLKHVPDTSKPCEFEDVSGIDPLLKLNIIQACQFGLMGQGIKNFRPNERITRGEFATILSRALWGDRFTKETDPYYSSHLEILNKLDVITDIEYPGDPEKRGNGMVILKRAADIANLSEENFEDIIKKLGYEKITDRKEIIENKEAL